MVAFRFTNPNFVISSANGTTIVVQDTCGDVYAPRLTPSNWKVVTTVGAGLSYDELNISGTVLGNQKLTELAKDLFDSRLHVNREGYCFLSTDCITNKAFGVECYRINDFFGWSKYKIEPLVTTVWTRCDMNSSMEVTNASENKELQDTKVELSKVETELAELQKNSRGMVEELDRRRERMAELEKELEDCKSGTKEQEKGKEENDDELSDCHEKTELKNQEVQRLGNLLQAEKRRSQELKTAVDSLMKSLEDMNGSLQKEVD